MKLKQLALAAACLSLTSGLFAAPITIEGNFVRATFTDTGVLSNLFYDSTGTRNFGVNDYIAPGTPFEGFGVNANGSLNSNSNSGGADIAGSLSGPGGVNGGTVTWSGTLAGVYDITHVFSFSLLDQRVSISTTLTALQNLTGVSVSRAVDPDPDVFAFGNFDTINQRGLASPSIAASDFVGSLGAVSGLPLGLLYTGAVAHNTGISGFCCGVTDPLFYLGGGDLGNNSTGDHGIGIGFNLGDMARGTSVTWDYAYVMGTSIETIDTGVPEPATMALVGSTLLLVALRRRRSL